MDSKRLWTRRDSRMVVHCRILKRQAVAMKRIELVYSKLREAVAEAVVLRTRRERRKAV